MQDYNQNILVIGMSKTGKTHFGGQLYGRLETGTSPFSLRKTPDDLSLFKDILNRLNQGLEGKHTDSKLHETVILPIVSNDGLAIDLVYPDYGGEQLRNMFELRSINAKWQERIQESDHWFLFIRLDLIEGIGDITTKFYQQIETELDNEPPNLTQLPEDSAAFYIELLQVFLKIRKQPLRRPKLNILLSCWDKLKKRKGTKPKDVLKNEMPLLYHFVQANWPSNELQILGLSSTGRDLNDEKPDQEFAEKGPEEFGYLILENGEKEPDITQVLNALTP